MTRIENIVENAQKETINRKNDKDLFFVKQYNHSNNEEFRKLEKCICSQ